MEKELRINDKIKYLFIGTFFSWEFFILLICILFLWGRWGEVWIVEHLSWVKSAEWLNEVLKIIFVGPFYWYWLVFKTYQPLTRVDCVEQKHYVNWKYFPIVKLYHNISCYWCLFCGIASVSSLLIAKGEISYITLVICVGANLISWKSFESTKLAADAKDEIYQKYSVQ